MLLVAAGKGTQAYLEHARQAEELRLAEEAKRQEEEVKKREEEKATKELADLRARVAVAVAPWKQPLEDSQPAFKALLDGSLLNDEKAISAALRELNALPKPQQGDSRIASGFFQEASKRNLEGDYKNSIPLALNAVSADPSDANALLLLGDLLGTQKLFDDGKPFLQAALLIRPTDSFLWVRFGRTAVRTGTKDDGTAAFLNAIRFAEDKNEVKAFLQGVAEKSTTDPSAKEAIRAALNSSTLMLIESGVLSTQSTPKATSRQQSNSQSTPKAQSWRVPGRIVAAIPVRSGDTPCSGEEIAQYQRSPEFKSGKELYCIVAEDNTKQIRHSWVYGYPYVVGTTLWMRVFEDGHIVIE